MDFALCSLHQHHYNNLENHHSSIMSFLRNPLVLLGINLSAIAGSTYLLREHHIYNLEEHEARMDELEGTLRGHIGLIEESLDRLEGKGTEADRGKKMYVTRGLPIQSLLTRGRNEYYGKRGRDEKK